MAETVAPREKTWTTPEEVALSAMCGLGSVLLAQVFRRSPDSIRKKASRLGKSVKRVSEIRDTELTRFAVEYLRTKNPEMLCPGCFRRLVAITDSGLCGVCHTHALTSRHRETLEELAAFREYNAVKKKVERARRNLGISTCKTAR